MRHAINIQRVSRLPGIPVDALFRQWLNAALERPATVTLRIVNAAEGCRLNSDFRGKGYATNVLTFVYHDPGAREWAGDIVLCAPVVAREAREHGKPLVAHYAHLTIHGALHLSGMDHVRAREAKAMEARETALLAGFGIGDPYRAGSISAL
jgi:probable rRNA maturation factor